MCGLLIATSLVVLLCASHADAQVWGEIELPGGVTAARTVLGLGTETRTSSAFLVDFIRTFHQAGDVDSTAIEGFERYLRYVQELRAVLAAWPDGLQLGAERLRGPARDRWRTVAEALALRLRDVKNRPVLDVNRDDQSTQRIAWLRALGVDVATLVQQLNQGERVRVAIASEALPLPLPGIWPALLERQGRPDIVRLGASHHPALLYVGLMALDSETLAFVAAHPKILDLDMQQAGVFAAFGRSIHVRGDRVTLPGGPAYGPVWVQLVDRRLDEPVEFIRRVLGRDEGRLAFMYDTVAHLPPTTQTALFDGATTTASQLETLERHYRWFKDVDPVWKVGTRPFFRPSFDPSLALRLLDVGADGLVGPSWWPRVLERITDDDGWPDAPIRELEDRRAGIGWALRWMFESKAPEASFRLLRYAQRQYPRAPKSVAPLAEVSLRGFARMPALMLALERMGVDDPAVLANVANAAMRLTVAGDVTRAEVALRQWQAGMSILEQVGRRRSLPAATRDALLQALSTLVPPDGLLVPGAVAAWLVDQFNPALGAPAPAGDDYEAAVMAAWLAPAMQAARTLTWEGLDYRIDRVGPVLRDATAVRAGVKGPTLIQLELLVRTRRDMAAGATTLDRAKDIASRLEVVRKSLSELRDEKNKPLFDTGDLEDAARTITRIRRDRDLDRVPRQVSNLDRTFDAMTARVLPALTYALAAAPTPQPQIFADIAERHLITGSGTVPPDQWRQGAWHLPQPGTLPAGGSGVLGAMLALDTALVDGQLRRLAVADASAPPIEGKINPFDRDALAMRLVHASSFDDVEAAARLGVEGLRAGQVRWQELAAGAPAGRAAAEATLAPILGEVRANLVLWLWDHAQPDAARKLLQELERVRLGTASGMAEARPLGLSGSAFEGCVCLRPPILLPVTEWLGRGNSGHLSVLTTDVTLRVAEALDELEVPLSLVEVLLPMALQDAVDRVGQFSPDDWEAVAVARFIPTSRVEEYLLALVAEGVLAPPATPGPASEWH